jgi:ABC-type sugar transport system ATPase subunit
MNGSDQQGAERGSAELPLCSVEHLSKRYGGVRALRDVSLEFKSGEVHAILGENGAGKSTLMKILAGAEQPDEGIVRVEGEPCELSDGAEANAAGIAIVFQELSLYPDLDVLTNLFAPRVPRRFGLVRRGEMARRARVVLKEIDLDVDLRTPVEALSLDQRQLVEIAKALLVGARILILDEPTSALSSTETERLFDVVRRLRSSGVAILFVSHRLQEIFAIADTISVLRDGRYVTTVSPRATSMEQLVEHMIGRPPAEIEVRPPRHRSSNTALRVEHLSAPPVLESVNLDVASGEIVGIAGLEGSGVRPLFETIFGLRQKRHGSIELPEGRRARSATAAVGARVAYVPADRRRAGLMLEQTVLENICQVRAGVLGQLGPMPSRRAMTAAAGEVRDRLAIRTASLDTPVVRLSGGNQQKIVLGKWLQVSPRLVLLEDPTRGVDIGAKLEIYQIVAEMAETGCAILFYSSELAEYEHMCERVLVMRRGRIVAEMAEGEIEEHALLKAVNTDVDAAPIGGAGWQPSS